MHSFTEMCAILSGCVDASPNLTHLRAMKPAHKLPVDLFYGAADEMDAITD